MQRSRTICAVLIPMLVATFFGCSGDPLDVPSAPSGTIDTGTKTLTWSAVAGATSYNLYIKTINMELGLVPQQEAQASKSDAKITAAVSPYSIESLNKCNTAYFFGITALNSGGESEITLLGGFGPGKVDCVQ